MSERKPYPSDSSDAQRALIEPVITAWKDPHRSVSGHKGAYAMREIVNAILYQGRTRCQWVHLPHDLPPKSATYYYFAAWRDEGTDQVIHELLRCQVRERARRLEDRTLVVLGTQSAHAAAGVPATTTGRDPAKRVRGRKRRPAAAAGVHQALKTSGPGGVGVPGGCRQAGVLGIELSCGVPRGGSGWPSVRLGCGLGRRSRVGRWLSR